MKKSNFLNTAIQAVKEAESLILGHYGKTEVNIKVDRTTVTAADLEAQNLIKKILKNRFPHHRFIGEESMGDLLDDKGYIWIVDPIDGTSNFARQVPFFATEIALMKDGELILGVSNAPLLKELLYAEKGAGAYCNDSPIKVSNVDKISESSVSYGGLKHFAKTENLDKIAKLSKDARWARGYGDFLSFHLLAQGKIDAMVEAHTKIWDIAALKVIVEEAGGKMTDINGDIIRIGSNSVIASNNLLHKKVSEYFND